MSTLIEAKKQEHRQSTLSLIETVRDSMRAYKADGVMTDGEYARRNVNLQLWLEAYESMLERL
jgi:hypothetical protein